MRSADCIVRTVQLWFLSVLPLLSGTNQVRAMLDVRRDNEAANGIPAHLIKDGLTLAVSALSVAACIFCLQCLRVVWPRNFRGESQHDSNGRNKVMKVA
jgi:hypothetical protein